MLNSVTFFFLINLLVSLVYNEPNNGETYYTHVGLVKGKQVFFEHFSNSIVYIEKGEKVLIRAYDKDLEVLWVNDSVLFYQDINKKKLYFDFNGGLSSIILENRILHYSFDGECLYFNDSDAILMVDKNGLHHTGIEGYIVGVGVNKLFFLRLDETVTYANAHLCSVSKSGLNERVVLENISGEHTKVSKDGNYIFDYYLQNGGFEPRIFDLHSGVNIDLKKDVSGPCFFDYNIERLIFYNPVNLDIEFNYNLN